MAHILLLCLVRVGFISCQSDNCNSIKHPKVQQTYLKNIWLSFSCFSPMAIISILTHYWIDTFLEIAEVKKNPLCKPVLVSGITIFERASFPRYGCLLLSRSPCISTQRDLRKLTCLLKINISFGLYL